MTRPHVTLKLATSLDGRIATASGESQWITSEASRAMVHQMRAAHDAVMIGAETARADNPSLLARTDPPAERQPLRVVVTSRLGIPMEGRLFDGASPLVVFTGERTNPAKHAILEAAGVRVEQAPAGPDGLDMVAVLERLAALDVESVLVEGGGKLAASLIAANTVDRLDWFRAPILLGADGRPALGALALARLSDAPRWRRVAVQALGPDLWESYERA
ncbi:diaminohydroxyphosphoribosylaminopyrimidine deaminase [alpha proteobacterium U9-1i]|nr:diaminohydroxyphosphoribosylaminopyrimidine deaminase [alpha proteobacterium U9-1i]